MRTEVVPISTVAIVRGKARDILLGERPALNLIGMPTR